jgi:hypothetical protein
LRQHAKAVDRGGVSGRSGVAVQDFSLAEMSPLDQAYRCTEQRCDRIIVNYCGEFSC